MTDLLQPQADQPEQIDPNKHYLSELVGEGKKFADTEALAKSKLHADQTIDLMKKRLDELTDDYKKVREENVTKAKLEDLLNQLATRQSSSDIPPAKDDNQPPPFDPAQLDKLVETKISAAKIAEKEQVNLNAVQTKLIERFGPNYQNTIKQQIETLGLSSEDFHALAKKSPSALFRTLGMDQQNQENFQAPFQSSQRKDNFAPTGAKKRTWAYYQELKRTDPQAYYYDRNIAVQMQKDAIELGESFRDGDYYRKGLHEE